MIGVIILAAGLGKRLGRGVKALVPVAGKPLIDHLLQKSGENVIIYTSKPTYDSIQAYLASRKVFLLQEEGERPMGNGTLYASLGKSPLFHEWIEKGVERISVVPIDNPLADPLHPDLMQGDLTVAGVMKTAPDEKMGSIVNEEGRVKIIEYSELTEDERVKYPLGNTGIFSANTNFFLKAAQYELPWHEKVGEKFIFDAFGLAKSPKVVVWERKAHFCPIKVESDIAKAEEILYNHTL